MFTLDNSHHIVEFCDLPELKPLELYVLFKMSRCIEPYSNKLVIACDVQIVKSGTLVQRSVKFGNLRVSDISEIAGCSNLSAHRVMKTLRDANIVKLDTSNGRAYYVNPKFVRVHNSLASRYTVNLFEHETPQDAELDINPENGEELPFSDSDIEKFN